jgi:hypothetical protein
MRMTLEVRIWQVRGRPAVISRLRQEIPAKPFAEAPLKGIANMSDYRWCEKCMMRTEHEAVVDTRDYNPRGRGMYRCKRCGRVKSMRHLRPSSEIGY